MSCGSSGHTSRLDYLATVRALMAGDAYHLLPSSKLVWCVLLLVTGRYRCCTAGAFFQLTTSLRLSVCAPVGTAHSCWSG